MRRLKFLLSDLSVMLITFSVKAQDEPVNSGRIIESATTLYNNGNYQEAIELYKIVSRNDNMTFCLYRWNRVPGYENGFRKLRENV